jgi:hypothetical protein
MDDGCCDFNRKGECIIYCCQPFYIFALAHYYHFQCVLSDARPTLNLVVWYKCLIPGLNTDDGPLVRTTTWCLVHFLWGGGMCVFFLVCAILSFVFLLALTRKKSPVGEQDTMFAKCTHLFCLFVCVPE